MKKNSFDLCLEMIDQNDHKVSLIQVILKLYQSKQ